MPSIRRPLAGKMLIFDLVSERSRTEDSVHQGRSARTLLKDGALRLTLVHLGPGGSITAHRAPGPITIQPLQGVLTVAVEGTDHELGPDQLLAVEPEVSHAVRSTHGGTFLLTLAHPQGTVA